MYFIWFNRFTFLKKLFYLSKYFLFSVEYFEKVGGQNGTIPFFLGESSLLKNSRRVSFLGSYDYFKIKKKLLYTYIHIIDLEVQTGMHRKIYLQSDSNDSKNNLYRKAMI